MVTAFTSSLCQRFCRSNVSLVIIKPGYVDTLMTSEFKKGVLWAKPTAVASVIVKAIDNKKAEVYAPTFWWFVMKIVMALPNFLFSRLYI